MQRTRSGSGSSPVPSLARQVWVHIIFASCSTRWARPTRSLRDRYHLPTVCLETQGEVHVAVPAVSTLQLVRQQETEEWVKAAEKKSFMIAYMTGKRDIAREGFFDNSRGSGLLAEARSAWRATYSILESSLYVDGLQTQSIICIAADETIKHIVIHCPGILPPTETTILWASPGFVESEDQRGNTRRQVETTKQRLEHWCRYGASR
ncbi:hypothetical protein MRX96_043369 [Rhipicephalus microplus]